MHGPCAVLLLPSPAAAAEPCQSRKGGKRFVRDRCERKASRLDLAAFGAMRARAAALLLALLLPITCLAHEVRPSFLELRETVPGEYAVLWKTPMRGDARLALEPEFSGEAAATSPAITRVTPDAAVRTWLVRAPALRGQTLRIVGLEGTMTDALVQVRFADGTAWTQRLTPGAPSATIPLRDSAFTVSRVYGALGVEHILTGVDHLLFVLALLILARERWRLLATVTAFTAAHSITLALATLGFVHVPQQPVEAVIALSIAFVAGEIVRIRQGHASLTARAPWIVAFAFGLLHGFGFAGALREVGLPQDHIPLALLFFNVGVELGQLAFLAAVGGFAVAVHRFPGRVRGWSELVPPYAIGTLAMFWMLERVAAF